MREKQAEKSKQWTKENAFSLSSIEVEEEINFSFLKEVIGERRLVWLGENGHGAKEQIELKVKICQYLQKELGFQVVVFQNGLLECASAEYIKGNIDTKQLVQKTIAGFWQVDEILTLFSQIQSNEMQMIGVDCQLSAYPNLFTAYMQGLDVGFSKKALSKIDELMQGLYKIEQKYRLKAADKKPTEYIQQQYMKDRQNIQEGLQIIQMELTANKELFEEKSLMQQYRIVERILAGISIYMEIIPLKRKQYIKKRAEIMSSHLIWICEELYPTEKVIVWGHNMHIMKGIGRLQAFRPMGSLLSEALKEQSYHIGFFMGGGECRNNAGEVYAIRQIKEGSMEDYMMNIEGEQAYVDFHKNKKKQWFNRSCIFYDLGAVISAMVPSKHFDGAFFIKKVHPTGRWIK